MTTSKKRKAPVLRGETSPGMVRFDLFLNKLLIILSIALAILFTALLLFRHFSLYYRRYLSSTQPSEYEDMLSSYYDAEEFVRMKAYMESQGIYEEDDYALYRQAIDIDERMDSFRSLSNEVSSPDALNSADLTQLLSAAYELYHYEDYSKEDDVYPRNKELLSDCMVEINSVLKTQFYMSEEEITALYAGKEPGRHDLSTFWENLKKHWEDLGD